MVLFDTKFIEILVRETDLCWFCGYFLNIIINEIIIHLPLLYSLICALCTMPYAGIQLRNSGLLVICSSPL